MRRVDQSLTFCRVSSGQGPPSTSGAWQLLQRWLRMGAISAEKLGTAAGQTSEVGGVQTSWLDEEQAAAPTARKTSHRNVTGGL
jgi:hypothetical protein